MAKLPRVLTIAGSDSGGGAGIQADLKTITVLGAYGMSALTALTAQNTAEVRGVFDVDPQFVADQIDAVAEDIGVDAAKTGMLNNGPVIRAVADRIRHHGISPLVVDPVMVAKSGDRLLAPEAQEDLIGALLPLATVVTPNLPEAEALTGLQVHDEETMRRAAGRIRQMGPQWVLLKGGHLEQEPLDLLFGGEGYIAIRRPRVRTRNTHGTGCTYGAAIATGLAFGKTVPEAVAWARDALQRALEQSLDLGHGAGPLNHMALREA